MGIRGTPWLYLLQSVRRSVKPKTYDRVPYHYTRSADNAQRQPRQPLDEIMLHTLVLLNYDHEICHLRKFCEDINLNTVFIL